MQQNDTAQTQKNLQQRLREVLRWFSANEIARKTGTSGANVHRYLHGTRVPGWFCSAVVSQLGINPAWLLTGEGPPRVQDAVTDVAGRGRELLSLVQSMNALEHLRLGALASKEPAQLLQNLNDALARHEDLRARLDREGTPVLRKLLEQFRRHLDAGELPSARAVRGVAVAVGRFVDDRELQSTLLYLRANEAWHNAQREEAAELQYRLLTNRLAFGRLGSPDQLLAVQKHAMFLTWHGRAVEAMRVTRAALALVPAEMRRAPEVADTRIMYADAMAHTRRPDRAVSIAQRNLPRMTEVPARRAFGRQVLVIAQLLAGYLTEDELLARPLNGWPDVDMLQNFAVWTENVDLLQRLLDAGRALRPDDPDRPLPMRRLLAAVLGAALPPAKGGPLHELVAAAACPPLGEFQSHVRLAQIYRLRGKLPQCRKHTLASVKLLDALGHDDLPGRLDEATHLRNIAALARAGGKHHPGKAVLRDARKRVRRLVRKRYGFVSKLAAELDALGR